MASTSLLYDFFLTLLVPKKKRQSKVPTDAFLRRRSVSSSDLCERENVVIRDPENGGKSSLSQKEPFLFLVFVRGSAHIRSDAYFAYATRVQILTVGQRERRRRRRDSEIEGQYLGWRLFMTWLDDLAALFGPPAKVICSR